MSVLDVENLRLHYARTLAHWSERYAASRDDVAARFGEEFARAWELYLAGSEATFATGWMQLFQVLFAPRESAPPSWTRADLYSRAGRPVTRCDAMVVGGGPAGSTCARLLRRAGWDVVVIDKASFPRDKVCAGWLTPGAFALLELAPEEYRAAGFTLEAITRFRTSVAGGPAVETIYDEVVSYAVRRCEFDHFLLQAPGARVCRELSGANVPPPRERVDRQRIGGGASRHRRRRPLLPGGALPARRRRPAVVRPDQPVVAKEAEFRLPAADAAAMTERSPELFFCRDLQGYAGASARAST